MLLAIHLATTALFCILGIVFSRGKGAFLIAGYNTASAAEKTKYDEKALCKFMGKAMFAMAGCWLVVASSEVFHTMVLLWVGIALFCIVLIAALVYANTGNRFQKKH